MSTENLQQHNSDLSADIGAKPIVGRSERQTSGVGVYCKCGGIIYCCTDDCYKGRGGKKEVDAYFEKGYQVGRISKEDVQRLFGCKCHGEQQELF